MSEPIKEVVNIDRVVHEPARLAILLALEVCVSADFKFLQALTGLSTSNLSLHLTKLEGHGLIAIEKAFVRKTPRTVARLTKDGKTAIRAHRRRLENPAAQRRNGRCSVEWSRRNRRSGNTRKVGCMPSRIPHGYRAITTLVREQDVAEATRIADALGSEGSTEANRSIVIRAALVCLSDTLRGKSSDEIMQFFVNRRARRPQQTDSHPALRGLNT